MHGLFKDSVRYVRSFEIYLDPTRAIDEQNLKYLHGRLVKLFLEF